jgi:hypothetical protein
MAELGKPSETAAENEEVSQSRLTPMEWPPEGYVPGKHAPWYCSDQPVYGPDELGEYKNAIDEMINNVNRCDAAARIWEVLQAWESRLFRRGYHFLNAGVKGWGMFGGTGSGMSTGASIMATQNGMKLFACNVYGARHDKISALLSRQVPGSEIVPEEDDDPMDQAAAEAAEDYVKIFDNQANLKQAVTQAASYFYTDARVLFLTYTVADQARWGTEVANREEKTYGIPESEGVSPETEMDQPSGGDQQPTRRETVFVGGKLESKVPLMADEEHEMGWVRYQHECGVNMLRAKYPWVRERIATQGNVGGMDQIDRLARINVRLAVQASSSSGEAYKNDATETVTYFRPSEYEGIEDEGVRETFYEAFPDGMEVWHAGGQLAFVRNCRINEHVKIIHPYPGDGQNRRSIGTNYLPLQKVLNANISLLDRYFRSAVPRRFGLEPYIDTQAINAQSNDPSKITAVTGLEGKGLKIMDITGVENVPSPNGAMFEFIQWLISGAPEVMDGGSPAVFGANDGEEGTFGEARLNRDQALQVYSTPWASLCEAVSCIHQQAIESASRNRVTDISASLPGQQKLKIELSKLQGSVLVHPASLEIPKTIAEQEQQMAQMLEQSASVGLYNQIMNDPQNLAVFSKFPSLSDMNVPGADQVEAQQGEFEILMKSGPVQNPKLQQVQQAMMQASSSPESQTPEGQQALQQLQQAAQSIPPMLSTVQVAQDNSENHAIHAAITLGMLTSPTGRKLKYGDDEQKQIWQNLKLHWSEHVAVLKQLTPPPQVEMRANVSIDPTKLPPAAQSKAFQALGLEVSPQELTPDEQTHEIVKEQEGVDPNTGVPTKTKISMVGKPLS